MNVHGYLKTTAISKQGVLKAESGCPLSSKINNQNLHQLLGGEIMTVALKGVPQSCAASAWLSRKQRIPGGCIEVNFSQLVVHIYYLEIAS
jgi:hypothetical protein